MTSSRLGTYELIESLHQGGLAEVFLARRVGQTPPDPITVKRLDPKAVADPKRGAHIPDRVREAMDLEHPNILRIFELGEDGGTPFVATEYLAGRPLRALLAALAKKKERLELPLALHIASSLGEALVHAHAASSPSNGGSPGVIHAAVSPDSIRVGLGGEVKLEDYGFMPATWSQRSVSKNERLGFLSPEQMGGAPLAPATDLFALGLVLYELATGRRLYGPAPRALRLQELLDGTPPPLDVELPQALIDLLRKALARKPEERFQSANALLEALRRIEDASPGGAGTAAELAALMTRTFPDAHSTEAQRQTRLVKGPPLSMSSPSSPHPEDKASTPGAATEAASDNDKLTGEISPPDRAPASDGASVEGAAADNTPEATPGTPSVSGTDSSGADVPVSGAPDAKAGSAPDEATSEVHAAPPAGAVAPPSTQPMTGADAPGSASDAAQSSDDGTAASTHAGDEGAQPASSAEAAKSDEAPSVPPPAEAAVPEVVAPATTANAREGAEDAGTASASASAPGSAPAASALTGSGAEASASNGSGPIASSVPQAAPTASSDPKSAASEASSSSAPKLTPVAPSASSAPKPAPSAPKSASSAPSTSSAPKPVPVAPSASSAPKPASSSSAPKLTPVAPSASSAPKPAPGASSVSSAPKPAPTASSEPKLAPVAPSASSAPKAAPTAATSSQAPAKADAEKPLPGTEIQATSEVSLPDYRDFDDDDDEDERTQLITTEMLVSTLPAAEAAAVAATPVAPAPSAPPRKTAVVTRPSATSRPTGARPTPAITPGAGSEAARSASGRTGTRPGVSDVGSGPRRAPTRPPSGEVRAATGTRRTGSRPSIPAAGGATTPAKETRRPSVPGEAPGQREAGSRGNGTGRIPTPGSRPARRQSHSNIPAVGAPKGSPTPRTFSASHPAFDAIKEAESLPSARPGAAQPKMEILAANPASTPEREAPAQRPLVPVPSSRPAPKAPVRSAANPGGTWLESVPRSLWVVTGLVLLLLMLGLGFSLRSAPDSEVVVHVTPAQGALITLDGRQLQSGQPIALPPGEYELVAIAEGHKRYSQRITVFEDAEQAVYPITLEPDAAMPAPVATGPGATNAGTFTVRFTTSTPGVEIWVEGTSIGTAPEATAILPIGRPHRYEARAKGYEATMGTVGSFGDPEVTVQLTLQPAVDRIRNPNAPPTGGTGRLVVATEPNGAEVYVNGVPTGRRTPITSVDPLTLPVGKHRLRFALGERVSRLQNVTLERGQTILLDDVAIDQTR